MPFLDNLVWIIIVLLVLLIALALLAYVKAPPDTAYIVSGLKREPKVIIGGSGFRIPFLQRLDKLYLGQMSVDIRTSQPVPTNDFIDVTVDAVSKVRINPSKEGIQLASKNFLNKAPIAIANDLQDSLQGNMREVIGTLSLKDITTDRDSFSDQVMKKAGVDMQRLGIEILSCNIQNVTDGKGLIADLGADNTAKITKDASIARAQAERDVAIARARADKDANDARVAADTEIAQKQNELAIRKAELKRESDIKKAEADAAYEIQNQEQQKTIRAATVNASIAEAEREAELRQREVLVKQQELAAQIEKQADAEKYRVEREAEAALAQRQRDAEAVKYEQQQEAEAQKALAEAARFAAEQEAAGIRAKGEAEAAAILAKGNAEAEAMERKAEAYAKYGRAAVTQMIVEVLPSIAREVAAPMASIDKVTVIGSDASGVSSVSNNVGAVMARLFETVQETTGLDLREVVKAETYDAKVNRNITVEGLPDGTKVDVKVDATTTGNPYAQV